MIIMQPFGLFVLGNPVLVGDGEIRFRDRCYAATITQTSSYVSRSLIMARTRRNEKEPGFYTNLRDVGAEMSIVLPDYGCSGARGLLRAFDTVFNFATRRALAALVQRAEFIYVEGGTSVVSFLTAQIARRMNRRLILEMRGSVVLNSQYLHQRFGPAGSALFPLHHTFSSYVRKQCLAGLYINKDLMERYPVAGHLKLAISDAYLPQDFGGSPCRFVEPARRYLYVGHLETIKRVDLIIKALGISCKHLPPGWHFDIVGSGPMVPELRDMVKKLSLGEHVTFHGRVPWGKLLINLYGQADLALFASTSEGAQRSLVEAMAFGLPVLSTHVGNAPELLDQSVLVPVGDFKTYAQCLVNLVNDPKRLTQFSRRNWELAQDFRQPILEEKRRVFWKQAIEMSRRERRVV